jgi:hypothetical protein
MMALSAAAFNAHLAILAFALVFHNDNNDYCSSMTGNSDWHHGDRMKVMFAVVSINEFKSQWLAVLNPGTSQDCRHGHATIRTLMRFLIRHAALQ